MTVLIAMFLFGLVIALGSWVYSWTGNVKKELLVKVFMTADASTAQETAIHNQIIAIPEVKSVTFISKEQALAEMKKKYPDLTKQLPANPLPDAFEVTPKKGEDVSVIAAKLDPPPTGVDKVDYAAKTSKRILHVAKIVGSIFLIGSLILLVASTLLIANTIRLSIFSRRREIEVMKLVGATNWFVRGPFMLEGLLCGLVGSVSAVILLVIAKNVALPSILGHFNESSDNVHALQFPLLALILVAVSLLVGAAGSGITLRRFLRI